MNKPKTRKAAKAQDASKTTSTTTKEGNESRDDACQTENPPPVAAPVKSSDHSKERRHRRSVIVSSLWHGVYVTIGLALMVVSCLGVAEYLQLLHENNLWFSNLKVSSDNFSRPTEHV
jgi:hypothetical protein